MSDVHPNFGDVEIFDDGDEFTLYFGGTHIHLGLGEGTETKSALAVVSVVKALQSMPHDSNGSEKAADLLSRAIAGLSGNSAGVFGPSQSMSP